LALANLVLPLTSFAFQPMETVLRRTRLAIDARADLQLADETNMPFFEYLIEKGLVSGNARGGGRYRGYTLSKEAGVWRGARGPNEVSSLPVYKVDIWMADPGVKSTVGAPTPENAREVVDLLLQLRLLSPAKGSLTAAGHLVASLRRHYEAGSSSSNPFVTSIEMVGLARQVVEVDGIFLAEVLREVAGMAPEVRRDDLAVGHMPTIAGRVVERLKQLRRPPTEVASAKAFAKLITSTASKSRSTAPGVLEHRLAPRLEWLVDMGVLSKVGLPKNGFTYRTSPNLQSFLSILDQFVNGTTSSDEVALSVWAKQLGTTPTPEVPTQAGRRRAMVTAYGMLRRAVGPTPIREVTLAASVLLECKAMPKALTEDLLQWVSSGTGVSVSGGRYRRDPEMVHMVDAVLKPGPSA
jgi:hypothetical protein